MMSIALVQAAQVASKPLAKTLRSQLMNDELDFLAQHINPVISERAQYLREAAACLSA